MHIETEEVVLFFFPFLQNNSGEISTLFPSSSSFFCEYDVSKLLRICSSTSRFIILIQIKVSRNFFLKYYE